MHTTAVLRCLLTRNKIHAPYFTYDLTLKRYLDWLVQKGILKYNKEHNFYLTNYDNKHDPYNCKYIKLKYFYYWAFPPVFKEEEIPEIKPTKFIKGLMEHGYNFPSESLDYDEREEFADLLKKGFIVDDEESDCRFIGLTMEDFNKNL
ncbi:MAG: hypothetical protein ABIB71_02155 [Candidatus Woesearchaeota archaeon]